MSDIEFDDVPTLAGAGPLTAQAHELTDEAVEAEKRRLGVGFWLSVVWVIVIVAAAILAPWLPIEDPNENLICCLSGSKRLWLYPPSDARCLYPLPAGEPSRMPPWRCRQPTSFSMTSTTCGASSPRCCSMPVPSSGSLGRSRALQ